MKTWDDMVRVWASGCQECHGTGQLGIWGLCQCVRAGIARTDPLPVSVLAEEVTEYVTGAMERLGFEVVKGPPMPLPAQTKDDDQKANLISLDDYRRRKGKS